MASHDQAIDALLNKGLRNQGLESVLASNCVLDWFGRTFIGQRKVIAFYQHSNSSHEHSMTDAKTTEEFEDRPYHLLTREQPLENLKNAPDMTGEETWFDCETHSPMDAKEGHRTPQHRATPSHCPPAPCRFGIKPLTPSDDELDSDTDDDDLNLSGVRPLDSSIAIIKEKEVESPDCKRLKREEKQETTEVETCPPLESKFSQLYYLEASGTVTIKRQTMPSDDPEKRECRMLVSYRINKEDSSMIQIALIVYKSNSKNPKTRRNLMTEFEEKASELMSPCTFNTPSTSRSRTAVKDRKKADEKSKEAATDPSSAKYSKATKRPMISKSSLRF